MEKKLRQEKRDRQKNGKKVKKNVDKSI